MPKPKETPTEEPKVAPTGVPMEMVQELVSEFKDTVKSLAAKPPADAAPAESTEQRRARLMEKYNATREAVNEKAAQGDVAGAVEDLYGAFSEVNAANQIAPENDKSTLALIKQAEKLARLDKKEIFAKYGSEIGVAMEDRPISDRLDATVWEAVAVDVRGRHFDEELEAAQKEWGTKQPDGVNTPVASARGTASTSSDETTAEDLDEMQIVCAEACNMDVERYAKSIDRYNAAKQRDGNVLIMDDETPGEIAPGKF